MSSARLQQRQEWMDYLDAIPYFQDIAIYLEEKKDIENELKRRLGTKIQTDGKAGLCIILTSVDIRQEKVSDSAPVVEYVHCAHIVEEPKINMDATYGTLKTREEVTEKIIAYTHAKFVPVSGRSPFMISDFKILIEDGTGRPSEDSFFQCASNLAVDLPKCETPVITNTAGEISLAGATPGAAIFYTVDGTKPGTSKTLYTAPFTPAAGVTVRARAWLAGYFASDIASLKL